uniref:Uncharacterized protein n=1 Tax=Heterorhabditis bacteriophora TaxID=37862 RepID=A0A1I7XEV8_HETBA
MYNNRQSAVPKTTTLCGLILVKCNNSTRIRETSMTRGNSGTEESYVTVTTEAFLRATLETFFKRSIPVIADLKSD